MEQSSAVGKKILILGGTGFLGPALVEIARERGHTVTLFNRGKSNPSMFPDIEKLHGDREKSLEALRNRCWDVVIDTSGFFPDVVGRSAEFLAANAGRYLFISSISVYRDMSRPDNAEDAPTHSLEGVRDPDPRKDYGALKAACELAATAIFQDRSLILRPGLIVGPRDGTDRFTYWPARLARGGEVLAPGDGADPVQWIDVRDLAGFMVLLIESGAGGVYNVVGPERKTTMQEFLETCRRETDTHASRETGNHARLTWVDEDFLREKGVAPWNDLPAWIPRSDAAIRGHSQVSNARALAAGLTLRPISQTVRETMAWWNSLSQDRTSQLRAGIPPELERLTLVAWNPSSVSRRI